MYEIVRGLKPGEGRELVEKSCQRNFGISLDEFLGKVESGEINHEEHHLKLIRVQMIMPLAGIDPWSK